VKTVKIDDAEYDVEALSDDAKAQIASLQAVERRLNLLKEETAILQTAHMGYLNALRSCLPKVEAS
jgi:Family of unknown function (DUF6447)